MALSTPAAYALFFITVFSFLIIGLYAAYKNTKNKSDFLSSLRTQTAVPLALNWIASCLGSSSLYAYPEVGVLAGILGVFMYAFGTIVSLFVFTLFGPYIRKKCPEGFTITEFVLKRFSIVNQIYISLMSLAIMLCYMISELSAVGSILLELGNFDPKLSIITIAVVTCLYTTYGGLRVSIFTDFIQGAVIVILIIIATIGFGASVKIDQELKDSSDLLKSNSLGWQLLYIMPVAISFANLFHQGFWQRTFSSKNDKELSLSVWYGSLILFPALILIGFTGILAVWAGTLTPEIPGYIAFFTLFTIVATSSNDIFHNRLPLWAIRLFAAAFNIPAVILGLYNLDVLRVFLIGDLIATAAMPPILLGIFDKFYYINSIDAIAGGLGGFLGIFIFGSIYYNNASDGANLINLPLGLYGEDYSVLGAFIVCPLASLFFTFLSCGVRSSIMKLIGSKPTPDEKSKSSHEPIEQNKSPYEQPNQQSKSLHEQPDEQKDSDNRIR
ncbi:721_t:CDS:2 [Entrophospora sp. SA101]|nr:13957_t:CDS:2 [Entrophospora sp. SA101]CAJ0638611.1 721_t:CDS:2 [Entrophospora sp. SA101]CAJ0824985.1 8929_t:CDS:2 [Entrophospora sp. SA101]CAJ0913736.1 5166_t:CDS:2 [Entrophospora sp. SA101]CAJ0926872.1 7534_t:CDS:2 [Entrophospora sp. SA101]